MGQGYKPNGPADGTLQTIRVQKEDSHEGKLFIIEGGDGSGKATQTKLLAEHLKNDGYPVMAVSYPDYDSDSSASSKCICAATSAAMPMQSILMPRLLFLPSTALRPIK